MFKIVLICSLVAVVVADVRDILPKSQQIVEILSQESEVNPDGNYRYSFESQNGIKAEQKGEIVPGNTRDAEPDFVQTGSFSYRGDDNVEYVIKYVADKDGYRPEGVHIPQPPPIPAAILRALEWNAAHPEEDVSQKL